MLIDCYRLDLSDCDDADLALLDQRERTRAARFRFAKDRIRYVAAHAQVRRLLGLRLGVAPAAVALALTGNGKPVMAGDVEQHALAEAGACRFNLTHSGAVGYLAVASCSVGVDLELLRPIEDLQPLIDTYCSPDEITTLAALPPAARCVGFLGIWTRKEAALKAWGTGIGAIALDRLHVGVDSETLPAWPAEPQPLGIAPCAPCDYPALRLRSLTGADQVLSVAAATAQPVTVRLIT